MALHLAAKWEQSQTKFLQDSDDLVTIHYKPIRSGTNVKFDSYFQEASNPADPTDIGVSESLVTPEEVSGKVHLDMYGTSLSGGEGDQQLYIGRFAQADAYFTCLLSDVITSSAGDPIKTKFDNAYYMIVDKDGKVYEVIGIKPRGMGSAPFVVDVFLKLTNSRSTTTTTSTTTSSSTSSTTTT